MRTVRFFKGVCDTMKQDLNLPADYAVLSDNEMTYTQGGGVISTLLGLYSAGATIVGTGVLAASYAWGIQQTRDWLKQPGNKKGNIFTVYGRALDDRLCHGPPEPVPGAAEVSSSPYFGYAAFYAL